MRRASGRSQYSLLLPVRSSSSSGVSFVFFCLASPPTPATLNLDPPDFPLRALLLLLRGLLPRRRFRLRRGRLPGLGAHIALAPLGGLHGAAGRLDLQDRLVGSPLHLHVEG